MAWLRGRATEGFPTGLTEVGLEAVEVVLCVVVFDSVEWTWMGVRIGAVVLGIGSIVAVAMAVRTVRYGRGLVQPNEVLATGKRRES